MLSPLLDAHSCCPVFEPPSLAASKWEYVDRLLEKEEPGFAGADSAESPPGKNEGGAVR